MVGAAFGEVAQIAGGEISEVGKLGKVGELADKAGEVSKITGYTEHGLFQAIGRDYGHRVSPSAILDAVNEPKSVVQQANNTTKYTGKSAKVVLNEDGKVVTTMSTKKSAYRGPQTQNIVRSTGGGGSAKEVNTSNRR